MPRSKRKSKRSSDVEINDKLKQWSKIIFSWETKPAIENEEVLDYHSLLNVLNVLVMHLQLIAIEADAPEQCQTITKRIMEIAQCIHHRPEQAHGAIKECLKLHEEIKEIHQASLNSTNHYIRENASILDEIAERLNGCAQELHERILHPDAWIRITADEIEQQIKTFYGAIAKNSHERFDFAYDGVADIPNTYLISLSIETNRKGFIEMPPVLLDTLRDLAANARKYTPPGGRIRIKLHNTDSQIYLEVEDNGLGIPRDEVIKVVNYGFRGSNVSDKRTMGGGFGLTKALSVSSRYRGKMTIASELGEGTRISIEIPALPDESRSLISAV